LENNIIESNKTSLYDCHVKLNAKMVDFAGYLMPINYEEGIKSEYYSVRQDVGLFDVSHMGIFKIYGKSADDFLNNVLSNDVSRIDCSNAIYTIMCNQDGGIIDDLILYKIDDYFILIVNASNKEKNFNWLNSQNNSKDVIIEDNTDSTSLIAIQGPESRNKLEEILEFDLSNMSFYQCQKINYKNSSLLIARTGYTGELGFEVLGDCSTINKIWNKMISLGISPCGLAVRDILRIEMGYCLYGHEIDESRNAVEAGLNWILDKDSDFIGKKIIFDKKNQQQKIIFLKMLERGIPRQGCEILFEGKKIGTVTSGTFSYLLNTGLGIGYIDRNIKQYDNCSILIRGKEHKIELKSTSFFKNTSLRK